MASPLIPFMKQTCSLAAPGSVDAGGAETYGAATTGVACRATREQKLHELPDGEAYLTEVTMQLPSTTTIADGYKVTSITNISGTYLVRRVIYAADDRGTVDHIVAYLR